MSTPEELVESCVTLMGIILPILLLLVGGGAFYLTSNLLLVIVAVLVVDGAGGLRKPIKMALTPA